MSFMHSPGAHAKILHRNLLYNDTYIVLAGMKTLEVETEQNTKLKDVNIVY